MKKLLVLGLVLALVAILLVPVAAFAVTTDTTNISGTVVGSSLSITVPAALDFGPFVYGFNYAGGADNGAVYFSQGSSAYTGWSMTALGDASMADSGIPLTNYLLISADNSSWLIANGGGPATIGGTSYGPGTLTYIGSGNAYFSFYAAQYIVPADGAGTYTDTITFTASMTP